MRQRRRLLGADRLTSGRPRGPATAGAPRHTTGCGGRRLEVLLDPAGQLADLAVTEQRDLLVARALEQVAVVRDDEQRARPAVEDVLERGQRLDVEVVGGLVEQQHVGLVHQQPEQLQPAPLATGQVRHPRLLATDPVKPSRLRQLRGADLLAPQHGCTCGRPRSPR